ncbi:MAG: hypothetical protein AAF697_04710 [Pseudomonadota bacterium]
MARELAFSCRLESCVDKVRTAIMRPALFLYEAAPLVKFTPIGLERFPDIWEEREYRGSMSLFGVIPLGWQAIVISFAAEGEEPLVLRDQGYGPMLREWDHRIEVSPAGAGTLYTDRLRLDAGALTPIVAFGVAQFFKHRQRRLRKVDAKGFEEI